MFAWNKANTFNLEDIELYNIKVIVNNKSYYNLDLHLNSWNINDLGEFNEIDTLTIIRNGIRIINYDFNQIDRDKYKSLNVIEYF